MAGIKKFPLTGNKDNQIFEYTDTLSLKIDNDQKHLKAGDAVVVNKEAGIAGILMSDVAPAEEKTDYATAAEALTKPTYGLNRAQHASVRVKGGVFALKVDGSLSSFKPGTLVYLKAATAGGKPTITFTKAGADVVLGWVKEIYSSAAKDSVYQVVLDTRPLA
nr:MAG TPA: hypothetical protein [Caudoviricetes sp.]